MHLSQKKGIFWQNHGNVREFNTSTVRWWEKDVYCINIQKMENFTVTVDKSLFVDAAKILVSGILHKKKKCFIWIKDKPFSDVICLHLKINLISELISRALHKLPHSKTKRSVVTVRKQNHCGTISEIDKHASNYLCGQFGALTIKGTIPVIFWTNFAGLI